MINNKIFRFVLRECMKQGIPEQFIVDKFADAYNKLNNCIKDVCYTWNNTDSQLKAAKLLGVRTSNVNTAVRQAVREISTYIKDSYCDDSFSNN